MTRNDVSKGRGAVQGGPVQFLAVTAEKKRFSLQLLKRSAGSDAGRAQDDARDVGRRLQEQRLHEVPPAQAGGLARGELKHSPPFPRLK